MSDSHNVLSSAALPGSYRPMPVASFIESAHLIFGLSLCLLPSSTARPPPPPNSIVFSKNTAFPSCIPCRSAPSASPFTFPHKLRGKGRRTVLFCAVITAAGESRRLDAALALLTLDPQKARRELFTFYQTGISELATWLPRVHRRDKARLGCPCAFPLKTSCPPPTGKARSRSRSLLYRSSARCY